MLELSSTMRRNLSVLLLCAIFCLAFFWTKMPDDRFHIYFLDIGQGDSILIKTPENHQILVDGGPGNYVIEQLTAVMPFFDNSIDMVVLTHPDADHIGGLVEVLKRYDVGSVLFTGIVDGGNYYKEFLREIADQDIESFIAESSRDFQIGSVFMDVVYPIKSLAGKEVEAKNDSSVATKIIYGDTKILLTGDLEVEAERELALSGQDLKADLFKAGHHGSKTSSTPILLRQVDPDIVVIQCGRDNSFGHPHAETLRNFYREGVREVRRTDLEGRVEFVF